MQLGGEPSNRRSPPQKGSSRLRRDKRDFTGIEETSSQITRLAVLPPVAGRQNRPAKLNSRHQNTNPHLRATTIDKETNDKKRIEKGLTARLLAKELDRPRYRKESEELAASQPPWNKPVKVSRSP